MSTPDTVNRVDDPSGDTFAVRTKAGGDVAQGVYLEPEIQADILSHYGSSAAEENANDLAGGAGRLFEVTLILLDTVVSDRYLQVFDALTPTGNPVLRALCPAGGQVSIDFGVWGREFSTGITIAISTTLVAYTSPAGNEGVFQARFL